MNDYDLERLNTRSFEQLVQALAIATLGPQVTIFGDGPDGGREATFAGPVDYPVGKKPWNGYGIVQAKFRQEPASEPRKNADWVIDQLTAEFKKLKPRPKRKKHPASSERGCPEYYVFATNVVLSPVARRGGKDRVPALFEGFKGFKTSHGLRDYAIWDITDVNAAIVAIVPELLTHPEQQPILRALSYLPPFEAIASIPEAMLETRRFEHAESASAATAIRLNGLRWREGRAAEMAREALAIRGAYPEQLSQLLEFVDWTGKSGPHFELFLVELLRQASGEAGGVLNDLFTTTLVNVVERRPAVGSLPDPLEPLWTPPRA